VNRMTPNNFCNTVPPGQSNIFCPDALLIPQGVFPTKLSSDANSRRPLASSQYWRPAGAPADFQRERPGARLLRGCQCPGWNGQPNTSIFNKQMRGGGCRASSQSHQDIRERYRGYRCNAAGDKLLIVSRGGNSGVPRRLDSSGKSTF
jgi:hypothetical protein